MSDPKAPNRGAAFETAEASSAIRALALPDIIDGRYRILGRVGAGSMGVVLRGDDIFLDRPVAIKIVEPSSDPAVGQRFMKEAQALAQLRHENIVQVYAFGPFQYSAYLAMELVVGESLERVIDAHVAARLQCRILAEAANGPTTPEADEVLNQRRSEIFVIPDILCNSGGVIVSYFEWVQDLQQLFWHRAEVIDRLRGLLDNAFGRVMERVEKDDIPHRTAAMAIGVDKVAKAKATRGLFP